MIASTGKHLSVIISTEADQDWQTFATWYSFYKNVPEAPVTIICSRNGVVPFQYFQWAKRLNIPIIHYTPDTDNPVKNQLDALQQVNKLTTWFSLIVRPLTMALDVLDKKTLDLIHSREEIFDDQVWYLKKPKLSELIQRYETITAEKNILCGEAKNPEETRPLVSYHKGCGRWIHTLKGCPFSNVNGLTIENMTLNESKIFDLWRRMCSLYSVLS